MSVKDAVGEVALATGRSKREVYQRALELSEEDGDGARAEPLNRRAAARNASEIVAFRLGISAESRAAAYLVAKGFRILSRRWKSPLGEIDIVARRRKLLIFVEVKARATLDAAAESVASAPAPADRRPRPKPGSPPIRRPNVTDMRFDAMLVAPGKLPRHIPGAFRSAMNLGAEPLEELVDLAADALRHLAEIVGDVSHHGGAGTGIAGRRADPARLRSRFRWCAARRFRRCGRFPAVAAPCSVTAAAMAPLMSPISRMVRSMAVIALDRPRRRVLHRGDLRADLLGGASGLPGERLDLAGHHREAAAGFAGARRLDGGVERQQIGLLGDVGDQLDDVADAPRRLVELR